MFDAFQRHLSKHFDFLSGKKLLVACSGGIDSMVLADLLKRSGHDISLAHCNYNLRGAESNGDQDFVRDYATRDGIAFFTTRFNTEAFANDVGLSIQIAARQLRYSWFAELLAENRLDYVLTAHHADDNLETFLINIGRGTGLEGLVGIPAQNEKIIRPLLAFSRREIEDFATESQIAWREDSSNSSDKYLRNRLRHGVVPVLKNTNPSFLDSFAQMQSHLKQSQSLAEDAARLVYKQVAFEKGNRILFKIFELKRLENYRAYLYQWLKDFGFTAWDDIYDLVDATSGKKVLSSDFVLLKDREVLELFPRENADAEVYEIKKETTDVNIPLKLSFRRVADITRTDVNIIFADEEKLTWPLTVRKWREGDWFYPIGLGGKKKVSKFFKDEKFSLADKADAWLLCSGEAIVWIIGHRMDDRFKVTDTTKNILQIKS